MDVEKMMMKAKVGLILNQPFYASLMLKRTFTCDASKTKTACTDGANIYYNPEFISKLTHPQIMGLLCHELMHITQKHHLRMHGRDAKTWNEACDFAINPLITDGGLTLPPNGCHSPEFEDMSAEQIYSVLIKRKQNQNPGDEPGAGQPGDGQESYGDVMMPEDVQSEAERHEAEAEINQEIARAVQVAGHSGKMPAALRELLKKMIEPEVIWEEVLARFLTEVDNSDYSFSRPNPRYAHTGFCLPSLYNKTVGDIVFVIDTSGSIDEEALAKVASEMQDMCGMFKKPIRVIYVDDEVRGEDEITPNDPVQLNPKGGWGTCFRPAFELLAEEGYEPQALVYFTDGCCHRFPEEPDFPVLWTVSGYRNFEPPFGETIHVK